MITGPLRSRNGWARAGWLAGAVIATGLVLVVAGVLSDFPRGYGKKQYESAGKLRLENWEQLHAATGRDLGRYIPIYTSWGLVVVGVIGAARSADDPPGWRRWVNGARSVRLLLGAVLGLALADVGETVLFRGTLHRLIDANGDVPIDGRVHVTQGFSLLKLLFAFAAMALLIREVRRPTGRSLRRTP